MKKLSLEEVEDRLVQIADRLKMAPGDTAPSEEAMSAAALEHRVLSTLLTIKLRVSPRGNDDEPMSNGEHPAVTRARQKGVE